VRCDVFTNTPNYTQTHIEDRTRQVKTRIGQWKLSDSGAAKCIAEGGGYVMCRNRGREPWCVPVVLWDEMWDYTPTIQDEIMDRALGTEI
jgi:hypothetical protein